ncbi:MAG: hypothetical protein ABI662_09385 [Dermatophilaceae bacterium]
MTNPVSLQGFAASMRGNHFSAAAGSCPLCSRFGLRRGPMQKATTLQ